MKLPEQIDLHLYADASKKEELLALVSDPRNLIAADDEPRLFLPPYRDVLLEYLSHHSLSEANQHLLFLPQNEDVLAHFLEHWCLGSEYEAKLFAPEYRDKWLEKYLMLRSIADSDNEKLLFAADMENFRHMYILRYEFHSAAAERKLFEPSFSDDLRLYIAHRRHFFNENIEMLIQHSDKSLLKQYKKYCKIN